MIPTTKEAYEKRRAELQAFEEQVPIVAQRVAEARAEGDLKENAEYHAQRENHALLEEKIRRLRGELSEMEIVDPATLPKDRIVFGRHVTLRDVDEDVDEEYLLVGPGEEDYSSRVMKILATSPLAQQLINHKVGEKVSVDTPGGKVVYEVMAIE